MKRKLIPLFLLLTLASTLTGCVEATNWSESQLTEMDLILETTLPFIQIKKATSHSATNDGIGHYYIGSLMSVSKAQKLSDEYVLILQDANFEIIYSDDEIVKLVKDNNNQDLRVDIYAGNLSETHTALISDKGGSKAGFLIDAYNLGDNSIIHTERDYVFIGEDLPINYAYTGSPYRLSYASSNLEVATVSTLGVIDGLAVGTSTITLSLRRDDNTLFKKYTKIIEVVNPDSLTLSLEGGHSFIDYHNDQLGGTKLVAYTPILKYEAHLINVTAGESDLVSIDGSVITSAKNGEGYFCLGAQVKGTQKVLLLNTGVFYYYETNGWSRGAYEIVDGFFSHNNNLGVILPYIPSYQHGVNVMTDINGEIEYDSGMEVTFVWNGSVGNKVTEYREILEFFGYRYSFEFITSSNGYSATQYSIFISDTGHKILINMFMTDLSTLVLNIFHDQVGLSWDVDYIDQFVGNMDVTQKIPHFDNDANGYKYTRSNNAIYATILYITFCNLSGGDYLAQYKTMLESAGFVYSEVLNAYTDNLDIDKASIMLNCYGFGEFYITVKSMKDISRSFPTSRIREELLILEDGYLPIVPLGDDEADYFEIYIEQVNETRKDIYVLAYGFNSTRVRDPETGILTHNEDTLAYVEKIKAIGYTNTDDAKTKLVNTDASTTIIIDDSFNDGLDICLTYDPTFTDYSGTFQEFPVSVVSAYFGSMCDTPVVTDFVGDIKVIDNTYAMTQNMRSNLYNLDIPWPAGLAYWVELNVELYVTTDTYDQYVSDLTDAGYSYIEEEGYYGRGATECGVFPSKSAAISQTDIDKGLVPAEVPVGYVKFTIVYYTNLNIINFG